MDATCESGAVRHGAECFNFYFPQAASESVGPWKEGDVACISYRYMYRIVYIYVCVCICI